MEQVKQIVDVGLDPKKSVVISSETMHQMKQRHKLELKTLKKLKSKRKGFKKEIREKTELLIKRHEEELEHVRQKKKESEMGDQNVIAEIASNELQVDGVSVSKKSVANQKDDRLPTKLSKAQRRRKRKEERERARVAQIEEEIQDMKDFRGEEMEQLGKKLATLSMNITEIPSDGHCLYRAIGDQLQQRGGLNGIQKKENEPLHIALRRHAAEQVYLNKSHFKLFLPDTHITDYCNDITRTENIVWGGHIEIAALAEYIKRTIVVHSAEGDLLEVNPLKPDQKAGAHLHLSYHKHYYGLGEHYNSLHDI